MFKKLIAFPLVLAMFIVQSHAATHDGLKVAFDNLNYALSVEWNQTDRDFYNSQMEKFTAELNTLQEKGLSNQDLIAFATAQVKDAKASKDLETAFTMIQINKMSKQEAQKYVTDVMNKSYSQGASWAGGVGTAIALILLVAVAAIVAGKARVGEGCYEVYNCYDYCTGSLCYEECDYECVN